MAGLGENEFFQFNFDPWEAKSSKGGLGEFRGEFFDQFALAP